MLERISRYPAGMNSEIDIIDNHIGIILGDPVSSLPVRFGPHRQK
jgi:hypothetical protein